MAKFELRRRIRFDAVYQLILPVNQFAHCNSENVWAGNLNTSIPLGADTNIANMPPPRIQPSSLISSFTTRPCCKYHTSNTSSPVSNTSQASELPSKPSCRPPSDPSPQLPPSKTGSPPKPASPPNPAKAVLAYPQAAALAAQPSSGATTACACSTTTDACPHPNSKTVKKQSASASAASNTASTRAYAPTSAFTPAVMNHVWAKARAASTTGARGWLLVR